MAEKGKKKKEKIVYYDDGRTIADMSRIGRFGHVYSDRQLAAKEKKKREKEQKKDDLKMSREERRAAFLGGLRAALPAFAILVGLCAVLFLIMYLWFRP